MQQIKNLQRMAGARCWCVEKTRFFDAVSIIGCVTTYVGTASGVLVFFVGSLIAYFAQSEIAGFVEKTATLSLWYIKFVKDKWLAQLSISRF